MDNRYVATVLLCLIFTDGFSPHSTHLLKYEPVYYNHEDLHHQHINHPSISTSIQLQFHAYNRNFTLQLHRDTSPLTSSFNLQHKNMSTTPDLSFIYTGFETGHPGSEVFGSIQDGEFQGTIKLPGEAIYHVVPSNTLLKKLTTFKSVIFSEKDYKWDHVYRHLNDVYDGKISSDVLQYINTRRNEGVPRYKRETTNDDQSLTHKICTLKLTSDHTMWRHLMTINNQNEDRTRNDIIFLLRSHVTELNTIFGHTTFRLNKGRANEANYAGIQFEIRSIEIMTEKDCMLNGKLTDEGICDYYLPAGGTDGLLSRYATREFNAVHGGDDYGDGDYGDGDYGDGDDYGGEGDYTDDKYQEPVEEKKGYCLSYLFTARTLFNSNGDPVLGLAFPPTPGQSGGICAFDANTGFITMMQYTDNAFLPSLVTRLVFTHEVAHSFGAQHDNGKKCAQYKLVEEPEEGFYLMHGLAQRGLEPNNKKFSQCSLDFMSQTLSMPEYRHCFEDTLLPFCGNNIVEVGEECDCGMNATCYDTCCYARGHNSTSSENDCKLKSTAKCSPSQGPCCHGETCELIDQSEAFVCQNEIQCVDTLYCDGATYGAACPQPLSNQIRPDGFVCNNNGRVCEAGSCNQSICSMIGWRECQLTNNNLKLTVTDKMELCYVGCQKNKKSECISTNDHEKVQQYPELASLLANVSTIVKLTKVAIQLPIGTPCNVMSGYCDVFYRCRGVDPDTPLVRLKNCLLGGKCAMQLLKFVQEYWWAVILLTILGIVVFIGIVKVCAIHTKSSNPELERKHPRQTVRQSIKRISSIRETVNVQNFRNSFRRKRPETYDVRTTDDVDVTIPLDPVTKTKSILN